jgi:hypothetical protein
MSPAIRAVFLFTLAVLPIPTFGQAKPNSPVQTTVCDLVKTPEPFDGKIVQFRAEYISNLQRASFVDDRCGAEIELGVGHVFDTLKPGVGQYAYTEVADQQSDEFKHFDRLPWRTIQRPVGVRLVQDENYQQFRKYVDAKFRWKDRGLCRNCPLYRTTVTATGRFDYFRKDWVAVRTDAAAAPYISSGNPLMRFTLQSVSSVVATPVGPSVYSTPRRRNVSVEEANDLVCVVTGGCADGSVELVGSKADVSSPDSGFYAFQALWTTAPPDINFNLGFFQVDPRTGDVWNGVICEKFTSPELLKLQRTIRQRTGLTDEEYRKTQKPGPMCEPEDSPPLKVSK